MKQALSSTAPNEDVETLKGQLAQTAAQVSRLEGEVEKLRKELAELRTATAVALKAAPPEKAQSLEPPKAEKPANDNPAENLRQAGFTATDNC